MSMTNDVITRRCGTTAPAAVRRPSRRGMAGSASDPILHLRKLSPRPPGATEMPEERMERRLAAILAADIAGYSALMGADEARTVRDLKAHQAVVLPMIGKFAGRIIDTAGGEQAVGGIT